MRLGVVWEECSNAYYRAIDPVSAMARRGHEVVWPRDHSGAPNVAALSGCDVVHVYRRAGGPTESAIKTLSARGIGITYDNDDDFTAVPRESPDYRKVGGLKGQRIFALTVKAARLARCFTTTGEMLAEKYRAHGVENVAVIPNALDPGMSRPVVRHEGLVIGWVAGIDHRGDALHLGLAETLRRLLDRHPDVRVECIGVNLGLPERYRHDEFVPFAELPARIGGFDIGIAPLVDTAGNRARSDIKLKEYAVSQVPWLASPVGPFVGLGEREGGRLVPDDGWYDALERLVTSRRERKRLSRKGKRWAKGETIDAYADRWERVFETAAAVS